MMQLLTGDNPPLAAWLADPVPCRTAQGWLRSMRQRQLTRPASEQLRFGAGLAEIIARHWAREDTAMNYQNLLAVLASPARRAQLKLVYGQLLIACKRRGAWTYLDAGFELAANLLEPDDYFVVLRRHASLRHLPLSECGADPLDLDGLLREAAVISRLTGRSRFVGQVPGGHQDTVD